MTLTVVCRDALYIPIRKVSDEQYEKVEKRFERDIYIEEKTCEKCDYFSERPCDVCSNCPNYQGKVKMHSIVKRKNDKEYLRLPFGAREQVRKIFGDVTFKDRNADVPMKRKIKFTGELRDNQKTAAKRMLQHRHGVLKSPPRSGKTAMGAWFVCELGQKTLILASQKDWLDNFHETFVGSDTQVALTDVKKKRIGFPKTLADFEKLDVCLCTYQKFLSPKGKLLLKAISKIFGVVLVDEVQTVGAKEFASVIGQIHVTNLIGLSGTPQRKDSKEFILYALLGPIFYDNKVEKLRPRLEYVHTAFGGKMPQQWTYMVNKIEKDPKRLKLIAETAIDDAKQKHLVLIPFTRVAVIRALTKAINQMAGKTIAAAFYGGISKDARKEVVQKARDYKYKIIVGNPRLLGTGINIPRASMWYQVSPSSNIPKAEQKFSRILTPYEGKPEPVIKYFLDDVDVVRACMRNEHWKCLIPQFRPRMTGHVKDVIENYFKNKKKISHDEYTGGGYI
jgi:superfamily II DNA or RNA helicase